MTGHNLFYYPYASLANAQLPLLKVAALYFDKLVLLDLVGASWDTIGADHIARAAVYPHRDYAVMAWPQEAVEDVGVWPTGELSKEEGTVAEV